MTKTIHVTYDAQNISLNIEQPDEDIVLGGVVEWVFHNVPEKFSPRILFKSMVKESDDEMRYYGPFVAVTEEIPGLDREHTRFWGLVANPAIKDYHYRAVIQTGVGEDPFDQPYGNSPDSVGKAVIVSKEAVIRRGSHEVCTDDLETRFAEILKVAQVTHPRAIVKGDVKLIPISEDKAAGVECLCIHDDFLFVRRQHHDTVVWDFTPVPKHGDWFPIVDFIGGEGMPYEAIKNMHFGPFSALTYTVARVIGHGHGKVPGQYHYRVAMANIKSGNMAFKSSPDPVVEYPEPPSDGGG